jgi:hypothetical protein
VPCPRMPRIKNLTLFRICSSVGVTAPSCTAPSIRTRRWATAHRASSENSSWNRRPRTRSALCVDPMNALCPRMRSGQGRSRRRRWRAAPALTRAEPWTNRNNHSLSGYSGQLHSAQCTEGAPQGVRAARQRPAASFRYYDNGDRTVALPDLQTTWKSSNPMFASEEV